MSTRTNYNLSRQPGVVDRSTLRRNSGRQIDWDSVAASRRQSAETVKLNGLAAANATSLTVDALPVDVKRDTFLKFGTYAPGTVTLAAGVTAGDVSMTVVALPVPIPANAFLDFGVEIVRVTTAAVAGATTLAIDAAETDIANADTATFNGGTIGARVTADAVAGATTLTVDELQFGIADNAEAIIGGGGYKALKPLTVMSELSSGKIAPRADVTGGEVATCILETIAAEDDVAATGYGCLTGGALYENLMPDAVAGDVSGTYKSELATAGCHFNFEDYGDNTTS